MPYIHVDTVSGSHLVCMNNVRLADVEIYNKSLGLKITYTDGIVVTLNKITSHSKEQLVKLISDALQVSQADNGDCDKKISYTKEPDLDLDPGCEVLM